MEFSCIRRILLHLARVYWRIFRPQPFGVKGIVTRPGADRQVLLIRNTYGNTELWNLPGGGYRPRRETPDGAIKREIREELSVSPYRSVKLGEYRTDAEAKRDTVTIFACWISSDHISGNSEIAEIRWVSLDDLERMRNTARVAIRGIELYKQRLNRRRGDVIGDWASSG